MSDTTSTQRPDGIDWRGDGPEDPDAPYWRLRMKFRGVTFPRSGLTYTQAEDLRTDWRRYRAAGITPDSDAAPHMTIADGAELALRQKRKQRSLQTGRMLAARTLDAWELNLRPFRSGQFAALPPAALSLPVVQRWYGIEAAQHPVMAKGKLDGAKLTLRTLRDCGCVIDDRVLDIEPVAHDARELDPLTVAELELLAFSARPYAVRPILWAGTTGMRWAEFTDLVDAEVDRKRRRVKLPPERCKERRLKIIPLSDEELELYDEQTSIAHDSAGSPTSPFPSRPPGTTLRANTGGRPSPIVFPTATGLRWRTHYQWLRFAWYPARARAADRWLADLGLEPGDAPTPFDELRPHDLRATAITLMLDRDMPPADVAARVGHGDGGRMIARKYDRDLERRAARVAISLPIAGLRAGDLGQVASDG